MTNILFNKRITDANRVDGSARNLTECASHTTVRTVLVYGGSQIDGLSFM